MVDLNQMHVKAA